ncbi:DUF5107 domain-containing protein [Bariatricus massiliensis]|uniref:DUF5107 domain-containing protein n=1 Tax=Bariatricus massiliensis TaxID=1745713 RepID=A0ABS8DHZ0_9FIRM|nr:DUF5107 domain-containing protein [Bariatricus massiliensis]MCB7304566.1 DUF5107 domain-containing protein [Bariatricus massiliensis]MCB7375218.1 DUF5107 domain-containing protein [Bariatricus massiliensis]MCB7387677.1 DUF5107 domain-containing protein [Bariatricus massiliensis]MCB7411838.1 DUF5107 domain-containing protein [Bariatricus massiliensis]MCQ5253974.1 DUF5107 domain-containing protein [Bariatricus massiliensis]
MKPELRFEQMKVKTGHFGHESCVPSFLGTLTVQNEVSFHLDEWDEIYEAYGRCPSCYPYRELNTYDRVLEESNIRTAVLENNNLTAVFLPDLGGRLWSLVDKNTGRNLLYTNDVIRFSNLAIRNAWFSGGVEWNIGIIGHTPLTTETLHTASLTDDSGIPILRMYAYERIREVEYQMDFWLGEEDTCLNCRMRIVNSSSSVVPMYWWSNMAVPEYDSGRIVVPADEAYTCGYQGNDNQVYKTSIPMVDGIDISKYNDIPNQVDYFFNIPANCPKYITNLDASGYGLLHMSTSRLQGRKLFSWGKNDGSDRWQEFLTEDAGRYVEIQAGLAKTQYGCLPMAPHTAWEWVEQYGPVRIETDYLRRSFEELRSYMTDMVCRKMAESRPDELLAATQEMAKTKGSVVYYGKPYGALKNVIRDLENECQLSSHLDYGELEESQKAWADFLKSGIFIQKSPEEIPEDFQSDTIFYDKLQSVISEPVNNSNWYAHYQLGVMHLHAQSYPDAEREFETSLELEENPWALHGLAVLALAHGNKQNVRPYMTRGISLLPDNLSYVKEGFRILLMSNGYEDIRTLYHTLDSQLQNESRIQFDYLTALAHTGNAEEAMEILLSEKGFVLDDVREGSDTLGDLYAMLYRQVYHQEPDVIPHMFNFHSLTPVQS